MTLEDLSERPEILLVEDNFGDVLLTREACESAAKRIHLSVASDGEEALAILRGGRRGFETYRPDVILLDLNLPRMDGRELLTAIKAEPSLRQIPVIVLTSSKAEINMLKSCHLKANGYIVKPVEFELLKEVVGTLETDLRGMRPPPSSTEVSLVAL